VINWQARVDLEDLDQGAWITRLIRDNFGDRAVVSLGALPANLLVGVVGEGETEGEVVAANHRLLIEVLPNALVE
jgi:hypothetical protein